MGWHKHSGEENVKRRVFCGSQGLRSNENPEGGVEQIISTLIRNTKTAQENFLRNFLFLYNPKSKISFRNEIWRIVP